MTRISGSWAEPCPGCGALDGCCQTSKDRRETCDSLGRLVKRQSDAITELERELAEKKAVIDDLRRKYEGAPA